MVRNIYILVLLLLVSCGDTVVYKDPSATTENRVKDLLSRMTIQEKAAQLDMLEASAILESSNVLSLDKMDSLMKGATYGVVHDLYPVSAELANQIQRYVKEQSRLGIPPLLTAEALHGYQGAGGTTFPIPLANSATWDTLLVNKIGRVIGREARAHGIHLVLGPNLDLAREPRWGRVEETFGEDTYLSSRMGVNIVKGIQGSSLKDDDAVIAEPKHFGVHGIPENGSNLSPVYIGEREMRSTHLYVFEKAITEANAHGIMAAYHEIDGIPVAGSKWLMTDILRKEWGFDGFVLSDLGAIALQYNRHNTAATPEDAIASSINAGVNMQFYDFPHDTYANGIIEGVENGKISMKQLDKMVGEILRMKFELGLFDDPYTDTTLVAQRLRSKEHQELALEAARSSIVMLKNDDKTLPASDDIKRIAVVGRLANVSSLGGYSPAGAHGTTIIEALEKRFGDSVQVDWLNSDISSNFTDIPTSAFTCKDGEGLTAEFFNNIECSGKAANTTTVTGLSHYWHNLVPAPGVDLLPFSVRFSGYLEASTSGLYEISLVADSYGRIMIDGKPFIDNWSDALSNVTTSATVYLEKGRKVSIVSEYSKVGDFAGQRVRWRYIGGASSAQVSRQTSAAAAKADLVIVVVGESGDEVGEAKDKQDLNLNAVDIDMVKAAKASGKPVVTVLLNGRPLVLNDVVESSDALLEAWFPGESGGDAILDVIFGDHNPSGRLTMSFPQSVGQLPIYYSRKPSAARASVDGTPDPLYPFGYGLSYTTFEYSDLAVSNSEPTKKEDITISLNVKNSGEVAGTEIVQLYIRDKVSSVTTPVLSLKGFSKIYLEPGEEQRVEMKLTPEHLSLINRKMKRVTEPGEFEIMVGSSSADIRLRTTINVTK